MRIIIFGLCVLFAAGVFAAMFLSIWSTARTRQPQAQSLGIEIVWAAIPCLMLIAAAVPAAAVILGSGSPQATLPARGGSADTTGSSSSVLSERAADCSAVRLGTL